MVNAAHLLTLNRAQIDALFSASPPGRIPAGRWDGTALIVPGSPLNVSIARFVHRFVWQGKTFDVARGRLLNRITPVGIAAVAANVYEGASWFDHKACIVLDYSKSSLIARCVRDEIREVSPGIYLGIAFWARWRVIAFYLKR